MKHLRSVISAYHTLKKFTPGLQKNLHGYIRHIRDIFQLCIKGEKTNKNWDGGRSRGNPKTTTRDGTPLQIKDTLSCENLSHI